MARRTRRARWLVSHALRLSGVGPFVTHLALVLCVQTVNRLIAAVPAFSRVTSMFSGLKAIARSRNPHRDIFVVTDILRRCGVAVTTSCPSRAKRLNEGGGAHGEEQMLLHRSRDKQRSLLQLFSRC